MCGRYYVDDETAREIEKIVRDLDRSILEKGEICPSQKAAVILQEDDRYVLRQMQWGLQLEGQKQLIINARCEGALQKRMFADSVMRRRCVIPAGWFYEWDKDKNKVAFKPSYDNGVFMAGFWKFDQEARRFVIITAPANGSVSVVHERMPLILNESECRSWLNEGNEYEELLNKQPDTALKAEGYIQRTLF